MEESRRADVQAAIMTVEHPFGVALTVDAEDLYVLLDATRAYVAGADTGAIFCAHASCERDLAVMVQMSQSRPRNSSRWGLGKLTEHFTGEDILPTELIQQLMTLNEDRKTLYHYGHSESDTALDRRVHDHVKRIGTAHLSREFERQFGFKGDNKELYRFAMDQVLRDKALSAIKTAVRLRSWIAGQLNK